VIPHLFNKLLQEDARLSRSLRLAANETLISETALTLSKLRIGESYYLGAGDNDDIIDFAPFTFAGRPAIGALEVAADNAVKKMLRAESVSFQCLSGVHAMTSMILALTEPDWTVLSLALDHGGHFSTSMIVQATGRKHDWIRLDESCERFDLDNLCQRISSPSKTLVYLDVSMNRTNHDLSGFRDAAGSETTLLYDASHTLGLMMGGVFTNPFDFGFDVLSGNSHKTLPGPQKAIVCFGNEHVRNRANIRLNAGLTSSVHAGSLIGLIVTVLEMEQFATEYASACVANANALGEALGNLGVCVRRLSNGMVTQNHQVHIELPEALGYRDVHTNLASNNIVANIDGAFGTPYLRIGTQYTTRMGMSPAEMKEIAVLIDRSLCGYNLEDEVNTLVMRFPHVKYSFDGDY
jgi:glycine hydroxymethyltransferase